MKQFFIGLICFLIVAGLGVSIYFNFDAMKSQSSLYTKEQMDEAVEKAYAEGNAKEQQYKQQIATLQNTLELAEDELARLEGVEDENAEQQLQISNLQTRISELKAEIKYYQELLGLENNENLVYVTFYFNDQILETKVLESGDIIQGTVDTTEIEDAGYTFNYWQDSEGEQIDLTTKVFVSNANIYANTTKKEINKYSITVSETGFENKVFDFSVGKPETGSNGYINVFVDNKAVESDTNVITDIEEGSIVVIKIVLNGGLVKPNTITINDKPICVYSYEPYDGYCVYTVSFAITEDIEIFIDSEFHMASTFNPDWREFVDSHTCDACKN